MIVSFVALALVSIPLCSCFDESTEKEYDHARRTLVEQLAKVAATRQDQVTLGIQVPDKSVLSSNAASSEEAGLMALVKSFMELLNQLTVRQNDKAVRDLIDEINVLLKASSRLIHRPSNEVWDDEVRGMYRQGRKTYKPPPTDARIREVIRQVIMRLKNPQDYVCRCVNGTGVEGMSTSSDASQPIESGKPEAIHIVAPPVLGVGDDLSSGRDFKTRHLLPKGRSMIEDILGFDANESTPAIIDGVAKAVEEAAGETLKVEEPSTSTPAAEQPPAAGILPILTPSLFENIQSVLQRNISMPTSALNPLSALITSLQQYTRTVGGMNRRLANISDIMSRIMQTGSRFVTGQLRDNITYVYGEPLRRGLEAYVDVLRAASDQIIQIESHLSDLRENFVGLIRGTNNEDFGQPAGRSNARLDQRKGKAVLGSDNEQSLSFRATSKNKKKRVPGKKERPHKKKKQSERVGEEDAIPSEEEAGVPAGQIPRPIPPIPDPQPTLETGDYDYLIEELYEGEQPVSPSPLLGQELPRKETPALDQLSRIVTALQSSLRQFLQLVSRLAPLV